MKLSKLTLFSALVLVVPALSANIISVNLSFNAEGNSAVDGAETFGIDAEGTVVGNWNNISPPYSLSNPFDGMIRDDGTVSGVQALAQGGGGQQYWGATYINTAWNYGNAHFIATANPVTMILNNLSAEYPDGYYAIVYVNGQRDNQGAAISDGSTTYYFKPANPLSLTPIQITDTDSGDGYDVGNYAIFGSADAPLTADSITFSIPNGSVLSNNAGIGGVQIVPAGGGDVTWAGYPVDEGGNVDTTPWMGFINVAAGEWVWSYSLGKWIYLPEEFVSESGAWTYATNF